MKRFFLLFALAAILAVPFALRPAKITEGRATDSVVVITPHNGAIRHEFGLGFARWYRERTGRTVAVDWRVIGGTSEIARYLESEYVGSFRNYWVNSLHRPWSGEVQGAFANPRVDRNSPALAREARQAFLASGVGCGLDVFFGGGSYDTVLQAAAGRLVPSSVRERHPEWFNDDVIPRTFAGEEYWDAQGRWFGNVLSNYGILCNRDALQRLGIDRLPEQWADLADPRFLGELALADPTKSSSMAKAFENLIQQQMQQRLAQLERTDWVADPRQRERRAVREGWAAGMRLIQLIGANARYFSDAAQKIPVDVAQGDCAAGICIDFYGRGQAGITATRAGDARLSFSTPRGGTVSSVDPIALLRGAPHAAVAEAFIEYTLTMEGQKLWNLKPGTPGGPREFALRRLPVRKDFYAHAEWKADRSDPDADPYVGTDRLIYRPAWTAHLFREMELIERVMTIDLHPELVRAWRAINAAPAAARPAALAALQDLDAIGYDRVAKEVTPAVTSRQKVDEIMLAEKLATRWRANYARAEKLAHP